MIMAFRQLRRMLTSLPEFFAGHFHGGFDVGYFRETSAFVAKEEAAVFEEESEEYRIECVSGQGVVSFDLFDEFFKKGSGG